MSPVLCRVDDGSRASFEGFAARFDAAVRLVFVRQHRQAPNSTANDRETDRGRLSPSSKQMVAMEIVEQAGCHGDLMLHRSSRKQIINCSFSPSSGVLQSVESSSVLPQLDDLAAVENGDDGGRKLARALKRRTTALGNRPAAIWRGIAISLRLGRKEDNEGKQNSHHLALRTDLLYATTMITPTATSRKDSRKHQSPDLYAAMPISSAKPQRRRTPDG